MARKFLTDIDLTGNELLNAALETLTGDPTTGNFEGRLYFNSTTGRIKIYSNNEWSDVGNITSITSNDDNIDITTEDGIVSIDLASTIDADTTGNAATATKWATGRKITLGGDLSGNVTIDGSGDVTLTADIVADSVALGTDTTGNYVATVSGTDGVSITGAAGEGTAITVANTDKGSSQNIFKNISDGTTSVVASDNDDTVTIAGGSGVSVTANANTSTLTVANTGVTSIAGTEDEIEVSESTGEITIGLPTDVTISGDINVGGDAVITGDLTVNGTTTTLNTAELLVEDNTLTLNSSVTGTPTANAGIEVERGTEDNTGIQWNETLDQWELTNDGTTYTKIAVTGDSINSSQVTDFAEAAQDAVGGIIGGSNSISATYDDEANTVTIDTTLATTSYLSKTSGLAVNISSLETKLVTDSFTKKVSGNLANPSNLTSIAFTHNLNTFDVVVNVYDNATNENVEVDVIRTSKDELTLGFTVAPASNAYRVVVIG